MQTLSRERFDHPERCGDPERFNDPERFDDMVYYGVFRPVLQLRRLSSQ
jgi:hypothetical protein